MRNLRQLDKFRITTPDIIERFGSIGDEACGAFMVPSISAGIHLRILASSDDGWDHVSVSTEHRTPTWAEMGLVKRLFFKPSETAMQLHVPEKDHINCHPFCLHLWRPLNGKIPLPPAKMVGSKGEK